MTNEINEAIAGPLIDMDEVCNAGSRVGWLRTIKHYWRDSVSCKIDLPYAHCPGRTNGRIR